MWHFAHIWWSGIMKNTTSGTILGFKPSAGALRGRLLAMGLTPGAQFSILRSTALGALLVLYVRGYALCLRKEEFAMLEIESLV